MARLTAFARKVRKWLRSQRPAKSYSRVVTVESVTDVPDEVGNDIFVVERGGSLRWALLMCPCGCGDRLSVNLMRTASPYWRLLLKNGKASLDPSLWVSPDRCGSHFWLIDSGVFWCSRMDYDPTQNERDSPDSRAKCT